MVKILPNGEIVADDDPRLPSTSAPQRRHPGASTNASSPPGSAANTSSSSSWSFGLGSPAVDGASGRGGIGAPSGGGRGNNGANAANDVQVESVTIFDLINEKMLEAGFPRLSLGPYSVEPIAVIGTCFALLLFGLPGLLLSLVLFFVVKFSRHGVPSLSDVTGGGAERVQESGRRTGSGRTMDGHDSSPEDQRKNPEEEKWGAGKRLGGR